MSKKKQKELNIVMAICNYLRKKGYLFYCDIAVGLHLTSFQAVLVSRLRCGRGLPDIIVFHRDDKYIGYAFEVKRSKEAYLKKDGQLKKDTHLSEQKEVLDRLTAQGWYANFVSSLDEVKALL